MKIIGQDTEGSFILDGEGEAIIFTGDTPNGIKIGELRNFHFTYSPKPVTKVFKVTWADGYTGGVYLDQESPRGKSGRQVSVKDITDQVECCADR